MAQPDGTFVLEASASPVRAQQNGEWVPVDTTLLPAAGNVIRPTAPAVDVAFSAGGAATPLVTITRGQQSYSLTAPWALPVPTLSGSAATYASVLPGVDLVMSAVPDGFTENVVVKTREAAANPELDALRFPISAQGLTARQLPGGGASMVDPAGHAVFTTASAVQWDSTPAPAPPNGQNLGPAAGAMSAAAGAEADDVGQPTPGAKTAVMNVAVDGSMLTVTPDQGFLDDPATVYPVVLDPPTVEASLTGWTSLWSNESTTSFWKTEHSLGVGYDAYVDNKKVESLYQFNTYRAVGKKILGATFTALEVWSANCTAHNVDLWRTSSISSTSTWSRHPTWQAKVDTVSAAKGYSASCPGGNVEFDATAAVAATAKAPSNITTLGLKADESDPIAWKQFASPHDTPPGLSITFVSPPTLPTGMRIASPSALCGSTWQDPAIIRDTTPTLSAIPWSADGSNATMRPNFQVLDISTEPDSAVSSGAPSAWTASGTAGTWTSGTLTSGKIYAFVARSEYKYPWNGGTQSLYTDWTSKQYCYFKVDTTAPPKPTISSADYPPCGDHDHPDTCMAAGGVGVQGTFAIAGNASDVVKYVYHFNGQAPVTKTVSTGTSGISVLGVPDQRDLNTLYVTTYDAAGNVATNYYDFRVAAGSPPADSWSFDEGSGTTAADSAGGNTATLAGGATWSSLARLGHAFQGNGTTAQAQSATSAVDTSKSFTVSTWVRLTSLAANSTFIAQRGTNADGFQLYYSTECGWAFNRHSADVADPTVIRTCVPATANVWTHLLGVYDAGAAKLKLYVNGINDPGRDVAFTSPWKATGPVDFGRRLYKGAFGEYVQGSLDEVQIWNRIMSPQETADLQAMPDANTNDRPMLAAQWNLADAAGSTTSADASGYGHTATLATGASFADDTDSGRGQVLSLNGSGYASAPGPIVDSTGDFTVAAWVRLDPDALANTSVAHTMRIVSQAGTSRDSWGLWYQQAAGQSQGAWVFGRTTADAANAATTTAPEDVTAAALVDPGEWTFLAGVYDAAHQQMELYVNGVSQGVDGGSDGDIGTAFTTPWQATGPLMIGRGHMTSGALGDTTTGLVSNLRVWTGLVSPSVLKQMSIDEIPTT
jgi:hypothetical protein